jgi:NarL family two-component system response regulator LiaR
MKEAQSQPIRVLLVDDHPIVREGLATFLKVYDDIILVGEAQDGETAIRLCSETSPDVVLMDMSLPVMDGPTTTRIILKQFPKIHILALTSYHDWTIIKKALEAGVIGYMLKNVTAEDLIKAIRDAHRGYATLSPEVTQSLVQNANQPPAPGYDLTKRECEVLALLIEGYNNSQIAEKFSVSESTIKSHVSNILSKLGVASRLEAVALAQKKNILP